MSKIPADEPVSVSVPDPSILSSSRLSVSCARLRADARLCSEAKREQQTTFQSITVTILPKHIKLQLSVWKQSKLYLRIIKDIEN